MESTSEAYARGYFEGLEAILSRQGGDPRKGGQGWVDPWYRAGFRNGRTLALRYLTHRQGLTLARMRVAAAERLAAERD